MSDIPETPTASARVLIGWFAGGLAFECVHQFSDGHTVASVAYGIGAIAVAIFDYNLKRILSGSPRLTASLNRAAASAGLWIGVAFLTLLLIALSPYVEERRWPFVARELRIESPDGGPIVWNFEQTARGVGYFLTMQKISNQPEIRVIGFGGHGKNTTDKPISNFTGLLRSEKTNMTIPIYLMAQEIDESKGIACFPHPWIPTLGAETFGIPAFAEFDIATQEKPFIETGKDGVPLSKFIRDFVPFTVILEYDGNKFERRFTLEEVSAQAALLEHASDPTSAPHVVRRPTAKAPPPLPLQTILPADPPKYTPSLKNPITPENSPKIPN